MIRSIYTAVSGMITQEAKQDVIVNNLANAETNGYKSDNLMIKSFDEVLIHNHDKLSGGKNVENVIGSLSLGSEMDGTHTTFDQGNILDSEKQTDFALDGNGFFTVGRQNALGGLQTFYTRDGNFKLNTSGQLVTGTGDLVMGKNLATNKVEPIVVGKADMSVNYDNVISLSGKPAYQFVLADFQDYKKLQKAGDNLYAGITPDKQSGALARQYKLEKSNVNVVNEVVNMMTVMRTFESSQKVIASVDDTMGKVINEVGSVR